MKEAKSLSTGEKAPHLNDVNCQLLNFIEVYEQNGSGWVFANFVSLQLSLWHLDPFRASAFVPLPNWIQTRRAVVNIRGTGNDCFKWAVLAGMRPVDVHGASIQNIWVSMIFLLYIFLFLFFLLVLSRQRITCLLMCMVLMMKVSKFIQLAFPPYSFQINMSIC